MEGPEHLPPDRELPVLVKASKAISLVLVLSAASALTSIEQAFSVCPPVKPSLQMTNPHSREQNKCHIEDTVFEREKKSKKQSVIQEFIMSSIHCVSHHRPLSYHLGLTPSP